MVYMNAFPAITDALLKLAHVPTQATEEIMKVIERFIVLLYDRTALVQMWKARKMFAKTSSV